MSPLSGTERRERAEAPVRRGPFEASPFRSAADPFRPMPFAENDPVAVVSIAPPLTENVPMLK
jgi:hypothetical protein